jgi:PleD family two-component response regulator
MTIKLRLKDKYDVFLAQSVDQLFEILSKITPDLILLDIYMPDADGYEVIKQIKEDPDRTDIPVIFFTSQKNRKSVIKGMELGAVDIIFKPISDEALIESIDNQLNPNKRESVKPVILAVDDTPSILQLLNQMLKDKYTVYTLPEPRVINELLKRIVPDLFILDYKMPGLTGFDLVPIIKNIPGHEFTPIIFLTSEGTVDHLNVAVGLGASDFMIKPINENVLRSKVETQLKNYLTLRLLRSLEN